MKKLITLLLVFMLTSTVNIFAANTYEDENGVERLSYTISPVQRKVTEIQQVVISFVTDNNINYSTAKATEGIFNENGENLTPQQVNFSLSGDKRSVIITPDSPITTPGTYTVKMSVGSIYEDLGVDYSVSPPVRRKGLECGYIEVVYTVAPAPLVPGEAVTPAVDSTVMDLSTITIPFDEPAEVVGNIADVTLGGQPVDAVTMSGDGLTATITSDETFNAGNVTLSIPEGFFRKQNSASVNDPLSYSWNLVKASLAIEDFHIYKGYTQEITIDLTNGIDFSGFQADLTLPDGLEVVGGFTLNRGVEGNHVLQSNVLRSTGKTRLLCYPQDLVDGKMPNLTGNSGALVTFRVEASADFAGGEIVVDGIVFSTTNGDPYMLQNDTAAVEAREYATEIIFTNAPEAAFETDEVTPEDLPFTATVNTGAFEKGITWTVEPAEGVITFENGIITAVGVGQATITATALGADPEGEPVTKSCTVNVVYTHATAIAITTQDGSETVAIEALQEFQLTATPTPATNKTKDIVWESSKPGVVTVDQTGKLTGVTVGNAVITAMIKDAKGNVCVSDTINVTVASTPATRVVIMTTDETPAEAPESAELHVTGTATYKAKVNDLATNKAVAWESNDPTIAEVAYNAETGIATVTAKAVGTAVITVKALGADPEGEPVVDRITINVLVTNAADIQITGDVAAQYESADDGDAATFKLTAVVAPDYTTYKNVAWVSSNPEAATVDQEGNVTIGSATDEEVTITAIAINNEEYDAEKDYSEYVKATVKFAVVHTFAENVAIEQLQESIPTLQAADDSNNTFQLTATATPTTNKDIVWTSSNANVATVDANGKVTAVGVGEATITATIEGTEIADSRVITVGATPGDVNNNGELDVFDINLLAAYILEADNLPDNFVAAAADYNGDGLVNVVDIIRLSNIVLTEEDTPADANARMYRTRQYADSSNSLFIEDFTIVEGETKQIAIMLNNNAAFSAFQADIYLPEGLEIVEATLSDRKADHTLASAMRNNGSVRLLSYSMGLNSYAGSEGELVYLTVKATDNFVGDFQIEIDNIKFATVDFAEYYLEPTVADVTGYTGVEGVEGDEIVVKVVGNSIVAPEGAEVYDLNGLRVNAENLAKGIYIVKVGNQVVKVII